MPRLDTLVLFFLTLEFIAGVVADIPPSHTTILGVEDAHILYQPFVITDLAEDCVHNPCSGWFTEPGPSTEPLKAFQYLRSTTSKGAQFAVKFTGVHIVILIAG
ncbi:hypothetical protein AURDEDRAFT_176069 [Auricularia subglabra TFB-10046 SS5]|uniref:Secreted protein n=1 Tax=Auricularia subglabra (strain TFB-10046 / SS5) TaxID=717982 RepID=J0LDU5_AURST|nr:hypothetical protein AURDEDRAFT_176069 [Auricularia subglabra TFB-10046 SS5]